MSRNNKWFQIKARKPMEKRLIAIYNAINSRCESIKNPDFHNYWWRWIKCEWKTHEDFYNDMFPTYEEWLQIDRIDNDWGYSKQNCRWATRTENNRNKRNNIHIRIWDETKILVEWLWIKKLKYNTYYRRVRSGMTMEQALLKKPPR